MRKQMQISNTLRRIFEEKDNFFAAAVLAVWLLIHKYISTERNIKRKNRNKGKKKTEDKITTLPRIKTRSTTYSDSRY